MMDSHEWHEANVRRVRHGDNMAAPAVVACTPYAERKRRVWPCHPGPAWTSATSPGNSAGQSPVSGERLSEQELGGKAKNGNCPLRRKRLLHWLLVAASEDWAVLEPHSMSC